MSDPSNTEHKDDFQKAIKMAKTFRKLGEGKSTFPIWEKEIKSILDHYQMDDFEKKRAIMITIGEKYLDTCNNLLYSSDVGDANNFIKKIKHQLGYDKSSSKNLNKLENIRIKNNNVRDYIMNFNIFLDGISEEDKPSNKRLVHYFVRGLRSSRYYDIMAFKSFESVDKAIEEVNKLADSYEEYEIYESKDKPLSKNNNFNNKKKDFVQRKDNYNKKNFNYSGDPKSSKSSKDIDNNEKQTESDIDNITNQFAQMKLYVCNRCNKKGHIAKFCTNEISPENLKIIQKNMEHLNY